MALNDISYLELWSPFCSAERYHLCNFGRGHHEEMTFKGFLSGALGDLLFSGEGPLFYLLFVL